MVNQEAQPVPRAVERDLRLDLFRGVGLWMIFLDHIPHDVVAWLTLRNYGFSDAAEFFVFISGYLAGFIYGPIIGTGYLLAPLRRMQLQELDPVLDQAARAVEVILTDGVAKAMSEFNRKDLCPPE